MVSWYNAGTPTFQLKRNRAAMVYDLTHPVMGHGPRAGINDDYVSHSLRKVELRIEFEVFVLVTRADYLDHGLWDEIQSLVLVGRFLAKYRYIGPLERPVCKAYIHIRQMSTCAPFITL